MEQALVLQAAEASRYIESRFQTQLSTLEAIAQRPETTNMNWLDQLAVLEAEDERLQRFLALGVVGRDGMPAIVMAPLRIWLIGIT